MTVELGSFLDFSRFKDFTGPATSFLRAYALHAVTNSLDYSRHPNSDRIPLSYFRCGSHAYQIVSSTEPCAKQARSEPCSGRISSKFL